MDGNLEFYTSANLRKRKSYMSDPVVKQWLKIFWRTFRSVKLRGTVDSTEYIQVHMSIAKALYDPEEWDEDDVYDMVYAEWIREMDDPDRGMDEATFYKSLFELVDTWASTIRLVDYRVFLQKLYFRITAGSKNGGDNDDQYQRRLRELEEKQDALRADVAKYLERIAALNDLAHDIAVKTKCIHDEKIKTMQEASQFHMIRTNSKVQLTKLKSIKNEKDDTKRAVLIDNVVRRSFSDFSFLSVSDDPTRSDDEGSPAAEKFLFFDDDQKDDEVFSSVFAASVATTPKATKEDDVSTTIEAADEDLESLIAVEEAKFNEADAKLRACEDQKAKLVEKEEALRVEQTNVETEIMAVKLHIETAEKEITAIETEATELTILAAKHRIWAPLHKVKSMRDELDKDQDDDYPRLSKRKESLKASVHRPENPPEVLPPGVQPQVEDTGRRRARGFATTEKDDDFRDDAATCGDYLGSKTTSILLEATPELVEDVVIHRNPPADFASWLDHREWTVWRDMCRGRVPPVGIVPPRTAVGKRRLKPLADYSVTASIEVSDLPQPRGWRRRRRRQPASGRSASQPTLATPTPTPAYLRVGSTAPAFSRGPTKLRPTTAPCRGLSAPTMIPTDDSPDSPPRIWRGWGVGVRW